MDEMGNDTKSFVTLTESGSSIKEKPEDCVRLPNAYAGQVAR